jgi:hypothetical protein
LTAALLLGAAAASVNSAPGFEQAGVVWRAPALALAAGTPVLFWLWARVVFDDDFILRIRHVVPWVVLAAGELVSAYGGATWSRLGQVSDTLVQLAALGLAVLAAAQTMATWRDDLVLGRRRLRVAVLLGSVLYISIDSLYGSGLGSLVLSPTAIGAVRAAGLCALAVLTAWSLFQVAPTGPTVAVVPQSRSEAPPASEPKIALQTPCC